ncbi:AAA family ATPase [Chryseobacterium sp. SNU WT5]|uniref:AAA family ATPase n=1 Tax=Chryseobacterium sp. SNU WT5 TaxID=2594269 RepID=UPI00117FA5C4|nr:AAA family ATPase [Chryseobacterium sp. SNU WT5]QDP86039.1 AAA family ATPase [Chryseobacterium sp. SNU WT5]
MNTIILKKLNLINFKGVKNLSVDFDDSTNIFGANGSGKTTIFDACTWLLFGKDSTDRKDFELKTLDEFNVVIPKIEHEVNGVFMVGNEEITIKKILKEKWPKIKGQLEPQFAGNETLYYWNEVPLSMKEFQTKVSQILDETIFKLITSPTAFNQMKWQDRRSVLIQIVGNISDQELAKGNADYERLVSLLTNKTLEEYKKQIASTIRKSKEDIKLIPTRIDEVERSKPEPVEETEIVQLIAAKEKEIEAIDNQLQDKSADHDEIIKKRNANQDQIFNLKSDMNAIEFEGREKAKLEQKTDTSKADGIRKEITEIEADVTTAKTKVETLTTKKAGIKTQLFTLETLITNARTKWNEVNATELQFNETEFCCPTCQREFEASDVETKKEELKANFITDKQNQLKKISETGKSHAAEKTNLTAELEGLEERIQNGAAYIIQLNGKLEELNFNLKKVVAQEQSIEKPSAQSLLESYLAANEKYQELKAKISDLVALKFETPEGNNSEAKEAKQKINEEITALRAQLSVNDQIIIANSRIKELMAEESKLAQEIANIEKEQYIIDNFIKLKIDTIESKINQKFSFVKFKLFETQINGAEVETCEALINGVPFSDANTASKINAGVDIINTLCDFYKVSAPIFIDNRESVVDLIDSESQIINLIVSAGDKKLRVA